MNFFRKTLLWKWMVLLWLEYCVKNFVCTNIYNVGIYNFCNMIKVNQTAEFIIILSFFKSLNLLFISIFLKSQAISAVCLLSYHQILNKKIFVHKIFRQKHNKNSVCFWSTATIFLISNYLLPEGLTSTLNLLSGVTIP